MTDEDFIKALLQRGQEAKDKVKLEFSGISSKQLNWKPLPESWSIAQCLDHLIVSDSSYFPSLEKVTEGNYKMSFWERYSPFSGILGRIFKNQLQEEVRRKLTAPKKFQPSASSMKIEIIDDYHKNLATFLAYVTNCRNIDLDKTIITSPVVGMITYSLRDVLHFLVNHEHRHINQAIRVKRDEKFPK